MLALRQSRTFAVRYGGQLYILHFRWASLDQESLRSHITLR